MLNTRFDPRDYYVIQSGVVEQIVSVFEGCLSSAGVSAARTDIAGPTREPDHHEENAQNAEEKHERDDRGRLTTEASLMQTAEAQTSVSMASHLMLEVVSPGDEAPSGRSRPRQRQHRRRRSLGPRRRARSGGGLGHREVRELLMRLDRVDGATRVAAEKVAAHEQMCGALTARLEKYESSAEPGSYGMRPG